jgi:hypothetical protein
MSSTTEIRDPWKERVDSGDWEGIAAEVSSLGGALLPELLKQALYTLLLPIARDRWPQYRGKPTASLVDLAAPMDYATRAYGYTVCSGWF